MLKVLLWANGENVLFFFILFLFYFFVFLFILFQGEEPSCSSTRHHLSQWGCFTVHYYFWYALGLPQTRTVSNNAQWRLMAAASRPSPTHPGWRTHNIFMFMFVFLSVFWGGLLFIQSDVQILLMEILVMENWALRYAGICHNYVNNI